MSKLSKLLTLLLLTVSIACFSIALTACEVASVNLAVETVESEENGVSSNSKNGGSVSSKSTNSGSFLDGNVKTSNSAGKTEEESFETEKFSEGLEFTLSSDGKSYFVTGIGACTDTEIVIPSKYNNLPVTSIANHAFDGCKSLRSVSIPSSVKSVGNYAFYCSDLTNVTIGNGVTSIGDYAFAHCTSLTSVVIPSSVTNIGGEAFYYCESLTSVTIPSSVTKIGNNAFCYCYDLKGVYISDIAAWCKISFGNESSNPLWEAGNLYLNGKLVTDLTIPSGVTSIADYAFHSCTSLTSVTIPNSLTRIGMYAFKNCSNLKYNEYDNAYYLGNNSNPYVVLVKAKNESITSCEINSNTKIINYEAFFYCPSLTSIVIPNSVTSIEYYAFASCTSLTSVTIPDSVTSIESGAFYNCRSLTTVVFKNTSGWRLYSSYNANAMTSGSTMPSSYLSNSSTAATYLTSTYYNYYWKRS